MRVKNRKRRNADSLCMIFAFFSRDSDIFTCHHTINLGRYPIKIETQHPDKKFTGQSHPLRPPRYLT